MTPRPLSARNPRIARLARLARQRSVRADERVFVVEGPKLLGEALSAGWPVETVFVESGALGRATVDDVVERSGEAGVTTWEVPDGTLARAADAVTSQGVVAVAEWADHDVSDPGVTLLEVLAYGISDPGNLGTILRAAEAAGADRVVVAGEGAVDPTNPKCVRASAGSIFHVPVVLADGDAHLRRLGDLGVQRLATDVRTGRPYDEVDLTGPTSIVLGSESHGLPDSVADLIDERLTIPMAGRAESLNVAMAGSVLCFEALRQRRHMGVTADRSGRRAGRDGTVQEP